MVKNISKYPEQTSSSSAAPVRAVNEEILTIIQNLKDTIEANSIEALSAYQIGSPYSIIVIKQKDGSFLELLNPLVVSRSGEQINEEKTAYFPDLSARVKRANSISVMYEDIELNDQHIKADGELAVLLQRKIDYTYGSSFIHKLDKEERKLFESKLEFGAGAALVGACPVVYKREYIAKATDYVIISMAVLLGASLFISQSESMFIYQVYLMLVTVLLGISYFFYAQYESKQYSSCTNCQIGDILGTIGILWTRSFAILFISYFIM